MAEQNCWNRHCVAWCALCTSIDAGEGAIDSSARKMPRALPQDGRVQALPLFERLSSFCGAIWQAHGGFMPPLEQLAGSPLRRQPVQILLEMGGTCAQMEGVLGAGV